MPIRFTICRLRSSNPLAGTFCLHYPISLKSHPQSADTTGVALSDLSILVVEDEPAVSALVTATLQAGRCRNVLTASTIAEASELWRREPNLFDIVLTDFTLPDGSAAGLMAQLLASRPGLDIVLMSGLPDESLGLEPSLASKVRVFPKPFRPTELLAFLTAPRTAQVDIRPNKAVEG